MNRRRRTALLLLAAAAVVSTVGVGGLSSAAVDRSVSVAVVEDDSAFLGVSRDVSFDDGRMTLSVTVKNRFPGLEDVSVTVRVNDTTRTASVTDQRTFTFEDVDCTASVDVTADGPGTYVELSRPVPCSQDGVDEADSGTQTASDGTTETTTTPETQDSVGDGTPTADARTPTADDS
jgi:hypothetical protein